MATLLPFNFTLLQPPKTRSGKTFNLISTLPPLLPLPPATPTAGDVNGEHHTPYWVAKLISDHAATKAWKVMEKEIYRSDISDQQNRFMIINQVVEEKIMPEMTKDEIEAANLMADKVLVKRRRMYGVQGEAEERVRAREHGGLEVMVYNRNGWGCLLYLTRWDAIKGSVLKGGNYREFNRRSSFSVGDKVEIWAFRGEDGKLFLAIGQLIKLDLSL